LSFAGFERSALVREREFPKIENKFSHSLGLVAWHSLGAEKAPEKPVVERNRLI
jgi:hypothetical protein